VLAAPFVRDQHVARRPGAAPLPGTLGLTTHDLTLVRN
jgi:hypothetical protein